MMPHRFVLACLGLVLATPMYAAVTNRLPPGDNPRAAWFERYAEARQGPEETDRQVHVFQVGAGGALDLTNISGDVRVTGDGGREIRIEAVKRVRHRDPDSARALLQDLRVEVTQVGNRVEVRTMYPRRRGERGLSARVDYVVTVPEGAMVAIKTISGDASVSSVSGEVRAETVSGDVTVTAAAGLALAKSVSGDVTVRDVGGAGSLALNSVSGSVSATGLKARSVDCGSVSGDIVLSGVESERLQAKSVSGDIEFGARLARGGRYDFTSHSGDVRIVLGSDAGFELDASTFSGSVRSDFPVTLRAEGDRAGRATPRAIRGSFGDASAILAVKTFSGSVVIGRK